MRIRDLFSAVILAGTFLLAAHASDGSTDYPAVPWSASFVPDSTAISDVEVAAAERLRNACPGVELYREGTTLCRVYGRVFGMGDSAERAAAQFLAENAELFGAEAADLLPVTPILRQGNTLPLGYDADTGTYRFTLVYHSQYRDGVPVFRAGIRLLVRNEPGNPLVWAGSNLKRLGGFRAGPDWATAIDPAQIAPDMSHFTTPEPVIWAGLNEDSVLPRQALTFEASNDFSGSPVPERWLFVVDAATGEVLHKENRIIFTNVNGSVRGMATTLPKSDICNNETSVPMKYAKVAIGSTTVYASTTGTFTIPNPGTTMVTVTSYMSGSYFTVDNYAGAEDTLTMNVTPPGPANFVHNSANTSEPVRAQTNAYVQANTIRDWVLTHNPSFPTVSTQTNFPIYVNRSDGYCPGNAWYDSGSISMNFCSSGGGHPNTAYSSVVHHEYGHHLCNVAGTGQDQYGEGVGDSVAVCIADDPILGYGFDGDCSEGIRTAANTMQYPCSSDIHTCAQLLSGCVWSTRNQLITTYPSTYLSILSNLMVDSIPMHAGSGTINRAIYADWITLDGGPTGPHYAEITAGFQAHNMTPPPPPANDGWANAVVACPGTAYTGSTTTATNDGATTCGTSDSTADVWYRYAPVSSGTATFSLCGAGTTYNSVLSIHSTCPGTAGNTLACDNDGCSGSTRSVITGLSVTEGITYYIRISGSGGATGSYSLTITGPDCAPPDTTPPTPSPMAFESDPAAASMTSITMTATTATDVHTPPITYFFDFVSGGAGGTDSGWQSSPVYTDIGLAANSGYTYQVKARDNAVTPNETDYSAPVSAVTDIQTPANVSFGTVAANSIVLNVATFFSNLTVGSSGLYFDSTTEGGDGGINEWVQVTSDTATDLIPNTNYTFQAKARNQVGVETPYGGASAKATLIETPTGVAFGTLTSNSIELIAAGTLPNLDVGSSGVYFDSTTTGGDGGINAWVQTNTDIATGLSPNTSYTFKVKARNQDSIETNYCATASKMTLPIDPAPPTLSNVTRTTLDLDVNANGNPPGVEFAVQCAGANPTDSAWLGKYVSASGGASDDAVWQTEAQWAVATVTGLKGCTTYTFAVKARNAELSETALIAAEAVGTGGLPGDMNEDAVVDGDDIQSFVSCTIGGGDGCDCANLDVAAFVNCLLDAGSCP